MKLEEFIQQCAENRLNLSTNQVEQFILYADLLKQWNEKMNLTGITEFEEVLEKHFFDSLIPFFTIEIEGTLCDVGSGAGFPSIPLKIAYPEIEVLILEPLNKRVTFLNEVIKQLGLEKVTVINQRAEDYAKNNRETCGVVTARAVANLRVLAELCIPFVKKGGIFLAMKGSAGEAEAQEANKAISTLGCELEDTLKYSLSDGSQRINLVYRKIKKTPPQYPRMYAKIKKNPL